MYFFYNGYHMFISIPLDTFRRMKQLLLILEKLHIFKVIMNISKQLEHK